MIEIIDDFLTNDEFNQIYNLVSDLEFPWFFGLITNQSKYCQFTHCFYQNDEPLAYFKYVRFLRSKLQMRSLVRIKVNINPWTETPTLTPTISETPTLTPTPTITETTTVTPK